MRNTKIAKQIIIITYLITSLCLVSTTLAAKKPAPPQVFVETITVKETPHLNQISSTGTLLSIPGIIVKPEISGRVTEVYFNSGDIVQKDTPLIEINPNIIKANLTQAEAELKLSELNFDRSTELYKSKDVSKAEFDKAKANYESSKAKMESVQAQLQQTAILAPFSGKLGLSKINIGDYLNAGQNIVSLQTIDPLKVDFSISESYQSKVAVGQTVTLKSDAYPREIFTGKVEALESLINPNNRTLNVRANVPNKDFKLMPGGFVEVNLEFSQQQLISVPQTAIVYDSTGNYLFKIVDGKAEKTIVTLGEKDSRNVIIKSGLKDGDTVVTAGQIKLQPGSLVKIITK